MISASKLIPHRTLSDDYDLTERFKTQLARLRRERHPLYLTSEEFDEILRWKLRSQYGRREERRKVNTEDVIQKITGAVLSITHS